MNKRLNPQDILLCILKNEKLTKDFLSSILNIKIKKEDKIIYTKYKDLISINNQTYININIVKKDNKTSYIYNAFKYYYEYFFKYIDNYNTINDYIFYQVNLDNNCFNKKSGGEIVLQIRERETNELLIDNFNIIYKSLPYYNKKNKYHNKDKNTLWFSLISSKTIKELIEISNILLNEEEKNILLTSITSN